MTLEELLKACASGKMPKVKCSSKINNATSQIGQVTVIKCDTGHASYRGCAVKFPPNNYDNWFYEEDGTDGRKHYMKELELVNE